METKNKQNESGNKTGLALAVLTAGCVIAMIALLASMVIKKETTFMSVQTQASGQAYEYCASRHGAPTSGIFRLLFGQAELERFDTCLRAQDARYPGAWELMALDECGEIEAKKGEKIEWCNEVRERVSSIAHSPSVDS